MSELVYIIGDRQPYGDGSGTCAGAVVPTGRSGPDPDMCGRRATAVRVHELGDERMLVFFCNSHDDAQERYDGEA